MKKKGDGHPKKQKRVAAYSERLFLREKHSNEDDAEHISARVVSGRWDNDLCISIGNGGYGYSLWFFRLYKKKRRRGAIKALKALIGVLLLTVEHLEAEDRRLS